MSRELADLDPRFQPVALKFIAAYELATGNHLLVTCTRRWLSEQEYAYAIGRTRQGSPCRCVRKPCTAHPLGLTITNARPGESPHQYGLALDAVPLLHGKLAYNTPEGDEVSDPVWQTYGRIARECGLEWGGDWRRNREGPHVQVPNWRALIAGATP